MQQVQSVSGCSAYALRTLWCLSTEMLQDPCFIRLECIPIPVDHRLYNFINKITTTKSLASFKRLFQLPRWQNSIKTVEVMFLTQL